MGGPSVSQISTKQDHHQLNNLCNTICPFQVGGLLVFVMTDIRLLYKIRLFNEPSLSAITAFKISKILWNNTKYYFVTLTSTILQKFDPKKKRPEAAISNFHQCRPEARGDVISGMDVDSVGVDVCAKIGDSRLNSGRIIQLCGIAFYQ